MSAHKSRRKNARLLLDSTGEGRAVTEVAAALGFTERQGARLAVLYGDTVPAAAESLLRQVVRATSAVRAFEYVSAAIALRDRRIAFKERYAERSRDGWTWSTKREVVAPGRQQPVRLVRLKASLAAVLDPAVEAGRCEGWELDQVVDEGRGAFSVKIGVYPWGKTIVTGTTEELLGAVRSILAEIAAAQLQCPSCGTTQPLSHLGLAGWVCSCSTRFFVRQSHVLGEGITGESSWQQLRWALLHAARNYRAAKDAVERIENGAQVDQVFIGAGRIEVLGSVVYYVAATAHPVSGAELPPMLILEDALCNLGLHGYENSQWDRRSGESVAGETWYEGRIAGEAVVVVVDEPQVGPDPDDTWPEIGIGLKQGDVLVYGDCADEDSSFVTAEEWCEWWCTHEAESTSEGWRVRDGAVRVAERSYPVSATLDHVPSLHSVGEATEWLTGALTAGVTACRRSAEAFRSEQRGRCRP